MKQKTVITPKASMTAIKASQERKHVGYNVIILKKKLSEIYDLLEQMDDDSFYSVDGESMLNDIGTYLRQVDSTINDYK